MIGYCCRNFNVDAESVVQDAFNIIWKKREASNSNSNSFAWLTFKNVLMTTLRSNRRRLIREDQYHSMSDKVYLNKEEDPRLVFLTNLKLKPKDQELFNMVFLKNKKQLEVAKILKTTENNVNVKVFRLKNKILKMYQEKTVQND